MNRVHTVRTVASVAAALLAMNCSNEPTNPREATHGLAPFQEVRAAGKPTDRYIVLLVDSAKRVDESARRLANASGGVIRHVYEFVLHGFSVSLPPQAIDHLRADPAVRYVEQVEEGANRLNGTDPAQVNPPWGLDRIDARSGLDQRYNYWETGSGVHVYIIDAGIRTSHTEFGGRASVGFDARPQDGQNGQDCNGHGTHVAGTAGGQTYGVAKSVSLVAVRVSIMCTGGVNTDDEIAGINWVAGHRIKPAVANISIGGPANAILDQAVQSAVDSGVTIVVSAGNNDPFGVDACTTSPARAAQAITVGATTSSDAKADFSNFGSCVDIFAPGVGILSAWYTSNTATQTLSGTSQASPHVAGTAARYLQYKPTAIPSDVAAAIGSRATSGALSNIGAGSPNLLLFSWFVDASISPTSVPSCGTYTFSATASGIGTSFTYVWEWGFPTGFGNGIFWQQVATGPTYSRQVCPGGTNHLRVTATNNFGHHRQAYVNGIT